MKTIESLSSKSEVVQPNLVLIGKNSRGQWVALEHKGLFGGLFVDRADAVRYALFENGGHPEAIISIAGVLELDIGQGSPQPAIDLGQRLVA